MSLELLTREYQALLEFVRNNPENEELKEDLEKARRAMEISWLNTSARVDA